MTLSISLSPEIELQLRQRAPAKGKDIIAYASEVLEQAAREPSLDEILAPLRAEFASSGVTDEELIDQITDARDSYRKEQ